MARKTANASGAASINGSAKGLGRAATRRRNQTGDRQLKLSFIGHEPPGRLGVYYQRNGHVVCIVPGAVWERPAQNSPKAQAEWEQTLKALKGWEQALQGSPNPDERVYLTFTDELVGLTTHTAIYRRGDTPVTPSAREIRRRQHAATKLRRRGTHYRDRHPRQAWRHARRVYRNALAEYIKDLSPEDRQKRAWFLSRFLRTSRPTPRMQRRLGSGIPSVDTLFTPLDYVPAMPLTKRQRRSVFVIANFGPLRRFVNDPENKDYRGSVFDAQRRRRLLPLPEIPLEARERLGPDGEILGGDPVWLDLYHAACLLRKIRARLYRLNCGCYVFAESEARLRCPEHGSGPSLLRLAEGRENARRARRQVFTNLLKPRQSGGRGS